MDFFLQNMELIFGLLSALIAWIIGIIWKKQIDKAKIRIILLAILDVVDDIAANPDTAGLDNAVKKSEALKRVEAILSDKKRNLLQKVFGTVGAAVEYVYKNRKWMLAAAGKIVKVVF